MQGRKPDTLAATPLVKSAAGHDRPAAALVPEALEEEAGPAAAEPQPGPAVAEPEPGPAPAVAARPTARALPEVEEPEEPALIPEAVEPPAGERLRPIPAGEESVGRPATAAPSKLLLVSPPPIPSSVSQVYLPVRRPAAAAQQAVQAQAGVPVGEQAPRLVYVAALLGIGTVAFVDRQKDVDEQERFGLLAPSGGIGREVWERAQPVELDPRDLADRPETGGYFVKLPSTMDDPAEFTSLKKALEDFLYYNWFASVFYSPDLDLYSRPDENQRDFRMRLLQVARERRDEELDKIGDYYEERLVKLDDRLRRAEGSLARKEADARSRGQEAWVSIGESVLGVLGRRRTVRAVSTYMSKRRMASQKEMEVQEVEGSVGALEDQIAELEERMKQEQEAAQARWEQALDKLEEVPVKPRRSDIRVDLFALAWAPHWAVSFQSGGTVKTRLVPAF